MVIDTSALIAIIKAEPNYEQIQHKLLDAGGGKISAATALELQIVLAHMGERGVRRVAQLLKAFRIEEVDFTVQQGHVARQAYLRYGKVTGHAAQLNFGDCLSYALAIVLNEPLLFIGNDFNQTDVRVA